MKKKLISDIRLYRSESQNAYGGFVTTSFGDKKLTARVKRVVMKLREKGFSLGEFDHLYLNFTTCQVEGTMALSAEVDRYHPWFRTCSVQIGQALYDRLGSPETWDEILRWITTVLVTYFASEDFDEAQIRSCILQALEQGEDMLVQFKEKTSATRRAVIYLRFLDNCRFFPLLRVYDPEDRLLFEKDLPQSVMLDELGEIQLSAKRVTVKPRKNAVSGKKKPMVFEYGSSEGR